MRPHVLTLAGTCRRVSGARSTTSRCYGEALRELEVDEWPDGRLDVPARQRAGSTTVVIFYADTVSEATRYAEAWASARGYSVELVRDQEMAA